MHKVHVEVTSNLLIHGPGPRPGEWGMEHWNGGAQETRWTVSESSIVNSPYTWYSGRVIIGLGLGYYTVGGGQVTDNYAL